MSQEVLEGNRLIAEFMGGRKAVFNITNEEYYKNLPHGRSLMPKELKYHTSWDWLMPVVEKIQQVHDMKTLGNTLIYLMNVHFGKKAIIKFETITDLWEAVVQFINFYNQTQKR